MTQLWPGQPDFVLVDGDPETYVDVWGVRGRESYEARKPAKQSFYRESGRTLLEWGARTPSPELGSRSTFGSAR